MNQDHTDEDWLDAVAGRPRPGADRAVTEEALAVRRALLAMRRQAADQVQASDPVRERLAIDKTLFALRREGLLRDSPAAATEAEAEEAVEQIFYSKRAGPAAPPVPGPRRSASWYRSAWAIAASVLVVTAIAVQVPYEDEASWDQRSVVQRLAQGESGPVVRGGGTEVVLLSSNPAQRARELVDGLRRLGARVDIKASGTGEVRLRVEASQPALDYLFEQRILAPQGDDGRIYLRLSPAK